MVRLEGLPARGHILINSSRALKELGLESLVQGVHRFIVRTVPATELALKHVGRPLPNAALLGGFAAATGIVRLDSIVAALHQKFSKTIADKNAAAASEAYAATLAGEALHA